MSRRDSGTHVVIIVINMSCANHFYFYMIHNEKVKKKKHENNIIMSCSSSLGVLRALIPFVLSACFVSSLPPGCEEYTSKEMAGVQAQRGWCGSVGDEVDRKWSGVARLCLHDDGDSLCTGCVSISLVSLV